MSQLYLPRMEVGAYFLCQLVFILYAIYNVFSVRDEIRFKSRNDHSFTTGWFGLHREVNDSEWENFKSFAASSIPWLIGQFAVTRFLKFTSHVQLVPWGYALVGLAYLTIRVGVLSTIFLVLNVIPYYLIPRKWGAKGVLLLTLFSLTIANLSKVDRVFYWIMENSNMAYSEFYQMIVIYGWSTLKCISFSLDAQDEEKKAQTSDDFTFPHFLGYVFYFPTLLLGPPIIYSRFRTSFQNQDGQIISSSALKLFLKDITKVLFWFLVLEFSNHFLYFANLPAFPAILEKFNMMALFGYGYLMGQHFQVKYVVMYGFGCAFAKLDGVETPPKPICIARVHKYSDMWKHFDRGLYEFLIKYIYSRLQTRYSGVGRKLFATFVTFSFIYIWHGYFLSILIWSVLNVAGIILEKFVAVMQKSNGYQRWIISRFSPSDVLRIDAVIGIHLLVLSVIANFFFLANYEVGTVFVRRTYCAGFTNYLKSTTPMVFMYVTSEYYSRRERKIKEGITDNNKRLQE